MLKYLEQHYEHQKQVAAARAELRKEIEKREERIERAKHQIEKLEDKLNNDEYHAYWIDDVVVPLMHDLEKLAGDGWHGAIYGPFGIFCETSIYLRKDMNKSICEQPTYALTLNPPMREEKNMKYHTGEIIEVYRKGSIGELNGENYVKADLPDTVEEIWKLMRYTGKEDSEDER